MHMVYRAVMGCMAVLWGYAHIQPAQADPVIWTLADEDTKISFLGTVHVLPANYDWRTEEINRTVEAADTVCFEIDLQGRALEVLGLSYRQGTLPHTDRLTNHLTAEQTAELEGIADLLGIPFASLNAMKPWFAALTIEQYITERMELSGGVELDLYMDIHPAGKTVCEIETVEDQITALSALPFDEQVNLLFQRPEGTEELSLEGLIDWQQGELRKLITYWRDGNLERLAEATSRDAFGNDAYYEALLVNRNANWVPRVEELLETDGNILIAVGAAHLVGDDSLIAMLRAKGYKIEGP